MLFGVHVSIAGGVFKAPANAKEIDCEVFQMFSRSPRGGPAPVLTKDVVAAFQSETKANSQAEAYIHAPYYINLASADSKIRNSSIRVIREELERASILGAKYIMTHLGSARDLERAEAVLAVTDAVKRILEGYHGTALLLLENSAGSGDVIGSRFEELKEILDGIPRQARDVCGICLDTCHAFASGYDLRTEKAVDETLKEFDRIIGLKFLKMIHINDSKAELGKRLDRHEHIGQGHIGLAGFQALIKHPALKNINMIAETPEDEQGNQADDLNILKKMRLE
ncbi:MAG: deoxyribonuclease IV [bacterium]|nr:deoxyribonuclease IV [bacterium]